jgi:large subunit ribosomal protein L31e
MERIYTIPLRDAFATERVKRAKRAMRLVKEFLERHMKSENVKLGKSINEAVWAKGAKKPPRKVRIHTVKEDEIVYSEMVGVDIKTPSADEKKDKKAKEQEKKEKIKQAREERKQMSLKEEIEEVAPEQKTEPEAEKATKKRDVEPTDSVAKQDTPKKDLNRKK